MGGGEDGFIETEDKYEVGADFAIPDMAGVPTVAAVAEPRTYELRATYYDTAGLRLAAARITLRRRSGGADDGWHLKLPAGAASRREVHEPLGPGGETVPAGLAALVAEHTGGEALRPVAIVATTRTVRDLSGSDGQVLAELADDRVTGSLPADASGQQATWREAARWREVEVELVGGPRDLLGAVGARLLQAGARPARIGSKLGRLLASR